MRPDFPHQIAPVRWAEDPRRRAAPIFLDKRLGKIHVSLKWAVARRPQPRIVLIVAPLSAIYASPGWIDQIEAEGLDSLDLRGRTSPDLQAALFGVHRVRDNGPLFCLCNPEALFVPRGRLKKVCPGCNGRGTIADLDISEITCHKCEGRGYILPKDPIPSEIAMVMWDAVIWDESPLIANPKSQVNRVAQACLNLTPYRAILSGDFALQGEEQIFEQMKFVLGGRFMNCSNFYGWRNRYFQQVGHDWIPRPGTMKAIKLEVDKHAFILLRKEAGLANVRSFERRFCDLPDHLQKAARQLSQYMELGDTEIKHAVVAANWQNQLAGGYPKQFPKLWSDHKLKLLLNVINEFSNEPLPILFRYNSELFAAEAALKRMRKPCGVLTGATPPADRTALQKRFNAGQLPILLMQIKVAKFGMDLSAASTMIRYSLPFSARDIGQSMDRICHPTKKDPLLYIDLVCRNTTDEDVLAAYAEHHMDEMYFMRSLNDKFAKRFGWFNHAQAQETA